MGEAYGRWSGPVPALREVGRAVHRGDVHLPRVVAVVGTRVRLHHTGVLLDRGHVRVARVVRVERLVHVLGTAGGLQVARRGADRVVVVVDVAVAVDRPRARDELHRALRARGAVAG